MFNFRSNPVTQYHLPGILFNYPWRCLWRGLTQITLITPWRLMILQLLHIFFTEARTFISDSPKYISQA
jgi:hypothetical protein